MVQNVPYPANDGRDDQVVTYKDAITTIDLSPLFYRLGFQYRRDHTMSLWVVRDCCGLFCAGFTWLLIVFAEYVMWYFILLPSINEFHNFVNGVIFLGFSCLAALSHIRAMFTDPVCLRVNTSIFLTILNVFIMLCKCLLIGLDYFLVSFLFILLMLLELLVFLLLPKGAVPRGNATRENIEMLKLGEGQVVYRCSKCVSIKPNRAHHCR